MAGIWYMYMGSQFRVSKEPVTNFLVLNNPAGDDLIYKTVLKKPTWFLGYNAANSEKCHFHLFSIGHCRLQWQIATHNNIWTFTPFQPLFRKNPWHLLLQP